MVILKNDINYIDIDGAPFFGIGFDTSSEGAWDGVSGPNECTGGNGMLNNAVDLSRKAVEAGANFSYVWGLSDEVSDTIFDTQPQLYGRWTDEWGVRRDKSVDTIPIIYNGHGESDMLNRSVTDPFEKAAEIAADFADFQNRAGQFSPESRPNLPPYEDIPYYSWHPTWRMKGGGDGRGERLTDEEAAAFARAANMMIGDNYTYVVNRWPEHLNPITGQKGPEDEGYDDWLAADDPDHREYFSAAYDLVSALRANATTDAVIWMWMQGHAFDDDIGRNTCQNGGSDLWAKGPFPTMAYLRKEITSTIVAGGTGVIFFGYMYNRPETAQKVRSLMSALACEQVYRPTLLSPEIDLGIELTDSGEGGRAHLLAKWDETTRRVYIVGTNPGAYDTPIELKMPFTVDKAELLDWDAPEFKTDPALEVSDKTIKFVVPLDDGFIMRITPVFAP